MPPLPTHIGRYEIQRLIGRGGMGELYLAHDPNTTRHVALKVLSASEDSPEFRERFAREARALAALNHPNVVHIYDTGEFEGAPFIVMEYVHGETLEAIVKRRAPLSIAAKLTLMMELCAGLDQAHAAGIVHRDIKPANLIVDEQGRLKIVDFGIARMVDDKRAGSGTPLTMVNIAVGTPGYMSPEQLEGGPVDHRSDLFAVAAVCYELLAYSEAFAGNSIEQVERSVLAGKPVPLVSRVPGIDPEIDEIVLRALKKDPNKRYQDAATFERALGRVRDHAAHAPALGETLVTLQSPAAPPAPETQAAASMPETQAAPSMPDTQAAAPSPPPLRPALPRSPAAGRRRRSIRAEAAYRRALDAYNTGAIDAARRFAAEAVAEDASYAEARELLVRLRTESAGPSASVPTIVGTWAGDPGQQASTPTVVGTWASDGRSGESAPTIIVDPGATSVLEAGGDTKVLDRPQARRDVKTAVTPERESRRTVAGDQPLWIRHRAAVLAIALLLIVAIAAAIVFFGLRWLRPAGPILTIERPLHGTVAADGILCGSGGSDCSAARPLGDRIELEPRPDANYAFERFTGDCAPSGRTTMSTARTCGATFVALDVPPAAPTGPTFTVAPVPTGGRVEAVDIKCGTGETACSAQFPAGEEVKLLPYPDDGFTFMGFTGDCLQGGRTKMDGPRTCSATFSRIAITTSVPAPPRATASRTPPLAAPATITPPPPAAGAPAAPGGTGTPGGVVEAPQVGPIPVAPTAPAPPPPTDEEYAKGRIKELLRNWCQAYADIDPDAVQRLYPLVDINALRMQLNKSKYVSVTCEVVGEPTFVSLDAGTGKAKVNVELKRVYQHTILTKKKETQEVIASVVLVRPGERSQWRIDSATYKAK